VLICTVTVLVLCWYSVGTPTVNDNFFPGHFPESPSCPGCSWSRYATGTVLICTVTVLVLCWYSVGTPTVNDNFFPGHFPERPIKPGVLTGRGTPPVQCRYAATTVLACHWYCGGTVYQHWTRYSGQGTREAGSEGSMACLCVSMQGYIGLIPSAYPFLLARQNWTLVALCWVCQAMAQVGGLVLLTDEVGGNKESFFFAGVDKVRISRHEEVEPQSSRQN